MAAPTVPLTPSPVDILSSLESSSSSTIATPALATADDSKAKSQGQGQKAPGISIHIPFEQAPLDLHNGLKEVAAHAIRGNVRFCQKAGHRWMGAAGANDERGKGDRGEWWWNVA